MQEVKGEFVVVISGFIRQRDNEASDEEILNRLKRGDFEEKNAQKRDSRSGALV